MISNSIFRKGLLRGKAALVTGGGTGIGFAIAKELLQLGCSVVIASRDENKLSLAAKKLRHYAESPKVEQALNSHATSGKTTFVNTSRPNVSHLVCNIRDETAVDKMVRETVKLYGKIDFLCNNGGGQFPSSARSMSKKGWDAVIDTNLNGTFNVCSAVFRQSMELYGGSIVNITADVRNGFPGMAHTGAARAGVENLTKTLALEWASAGVRVNCVSPGIIYSDTAAANYDNPNFLTSLSRKIPAKRLGTVDEVSAAVCFLFSPGGAYISGHNLRVDGGKSLSGSAWYIPDHDKFPIHGSDSREDLVADPEYKDLSPFEQLAHAEARRLNKKYRGFDPVSVNIND